MQLVPHRNNIFPSAFIALSIPSTPSSHTTMDTPLQVLQARRKVLASHPSTTSALHHPLHPPQPDPFSFESHGFFLASILASDSSANSPNPRHNPLASRPHPVRAFQSTAAHRNNTTKPNKKRQRRFVTNWTPEMDKVVRKSLAKYGWGSWTRIASSGKLPKEYTAKLIANRARAIGLTKQMFGPQVVPTISKAKS